MGLQQVRQFHLSVFPGFLLCRLYHIPFLDLPDQKRGAGIVKLSVSEDSFPVIVGITVQTAVSSGIVGADVGSQQTGAFAAGSFPFWHVQTAVQGLFQHGL